MDGLYWSAFLHPTGEATVEARWGRLIYSVGHSTRSQEDFVTLLRAHGIQTLVDVRRWPTSARFPHFAREALESSLAAVRVCYLHLGKELGGYRAGGYEAYMQTHEFVAGLDALEALAGQGPAAVL